MKSSPERSFPTGLHNAFLFVTFNALSFQMVLTSPMILFARSLDASATILGVISGLMSLLVIFQIPAASHIPRYGYRRFVYAGWGIRIVFIFLMGMVPLLGGVLTKPNQLALLLFFLFAFNLSRGISSCAWLPWITALIPAPIRGKFLAIEAGFVNFSSFVALMMVGWFLGPQPQAWQFSIAFCVSGLMGVISLFFLKRIPEGNMPEQTRGSHHPVPWKAIAGYPPFRKLLQMNLVWAAAYGGLAAFTVTFLKAIAKLPEGTIVFMNSAWFLGGLGSLWLLGSRLDRIGSKPVLLISLIGWVAVMVVWTLLAAQVIAINYLLLILLHLAMGLGASLVNLANTRLAMGIIPEMGRNHFFALFSVVQNLALGTAPILWGLLIDANRGMEIQWQGLEWNRYTIFFLLAGLLFGVTLFLCRKLDEPEAVDMEGFFRELLVKSPQRVWLRLWPRS